MALFNVTFVIKKAVNRFQAESPVSAAISRAADGRLEGLPDEIDWLGEFCFVQAADTQFGLISRYIDKSDPQPADSASDADIAKEVHLTRRLVAEVNAMTPAPRFLIVCGDMIDAFPATPANKTESIDECRQRENRRTRQLAAFADCFRRLRPGIPLVCVCGNHDIGDVPTPQSVSIYRQTWGEDFFEFWIGGCQMLVLNSQYYVNSSLVADELVRMRDWFLSRLRQGQPMHRIVFMHVPPFIEDADKDTDNYFTLPLAHRLPLLDACLDAGVSAIFCGHYHRNAAGFYRNKLPIVVTSAIGAQIGEDRHGYRLVTVAKDAIKHSYIDLPCFPVNLTSGVESCKACSN